LPLSLLLLLLLLLLLPLLLLPLLLLLLLIENSVSNPATDHPQINPQHPTPPPVNHLHAPGTRSRIPVSVVVRAALMNAGLSR